MPAQKALVTGKSGTGKSTAVTFLDPKRAAIVSPSNKRLPCRNSNEYSILMGVTDSDEITKWIVDQVRGGKDIVVIDDFQSILSRPFMSRILESGWDKYNEMGKGYASLIMMADYLPDNVTIYYLTHTETLDDGTTDVKLLGKVLREKFNVMGEFEICIKTLVTEGKFYFQTQTMDGKDGVKTPIGMFNSFTIDNNLQYVDDKIRNYYGIGDNVKTDAEMAEESKKVAGDVEAEDVAPGRKRRERKKRDSEAPKTEEAPVEDTTHSFVDVPENVPEGQDYVEFTEETDSSTTGRRRRRR